MGPPSHGDNTLWHVIISRNAFKTHCDFSPPICTMSIFKAAYIHQGNHVYSQSREFPVVSLIIILLGTAVTNIKGLIHHKRNGRVQVQNIYYGRDMWETMVCLTVKLKYTVKLLYNSIIFLWNTKDQPFLNISWFIIKHSICIQDSICLTIELNPALIRFSKLDIYSII